MPMTADQIDKKVSAFVNTDNQDSLDLLKRLGLIKKRMGQVENAGLQETLTGKLLPAKDFQPLIAAALSKRRAAAEALDRQFDSWLAKEREAAKAAIAGGVPTDPSARLLFEQLKNNLRQELEPLFVGTAGKAANGYAIVANYARRKRFADDLELRACYDVIQILDQQYPEPLSFPGVDRDSIFTGDIADRVSDETEQAEAAFALLDQADSRWQKQRRKRELVHTHASLLLNRRELTRDLVELFTDASVTPYEAVVRGGPRSRR